MDSAGEPASAALSEAVLDQIFRKARTHNGFQPDAIPDADLQAIYELVKWGPTTANSQPLRIVFIKSKAAKERLRPALSSGNRDKTMAAPVCALLAYDLQFHELLPRTFAHNQEAKSWFEGQPALIETTALRNSSIQGGYFIMAARALGYDCGPMSGFDNAKVDAEFFPDGRVKSNFLCNLGKGDWSKVMPRNTRLTFDEACKIL
jgi:3-hydroxypropanoate dehydrogenase